MVQTNHNGWVWLFYLFIYFLNKKIGVACMGFKLKTGPGFRFS